LRLFYSSDLIKMALNALLQGHADVSSVLVPEYIQAAPDVVRRRVCALKKLQLQTVQVQADFYKRVHELETEFRGRFEAVNKQRAEIVNGNHEPGENESDVNLFSWMDEEQVAKFNENVTTSGDGNPKGIPDFWLYTLKSVPAVGDMISECDEPVLKYLTDIDVDQVNEPPSFTLKFHFAENPYFKDQVLTKYYKLSIGPNGLEEEVLYDGPSIIATKGCEIHWNEGKNVTEKTIKKKKKGAHGKAFTTKVVSTDSFFRFFSPEVETVEKDMEDEIAETINADFEAGQMIRDTVIDGAVLYYTGESVEDDDYDFGGEDHAHEDGPSDDEE